MTVLAKTFKGSEYFLLNSSAHRVSKRTAKRICEALNSVRYNIIDDQTWHLYDVAEWEDAAFYASRQRFAVRLNKLVEIHC